MSIMDTSELTAVDLLNTYKTKYNLIKTTIEKELPRICRYFDNKSLKDMHKLNTLEIISEYYVFQLCTDATADIRITNDISNSFVFKVINDNLELVKQYISQAFELNDKTLTERGFVTSLVVKKNDFVRTISVPDI